MRTDIVHPKAEKLTYEIREIVSVATQIQEAGQEITWENIGDPVAKGAKIPDWIKDYVQKAATDDISYAYSPTKGLLATRKFIANRHNESSPAKLSPDDILFCNGLGDAIANIYNTLHPQARVIGPDPAYPLHATAEAAHAGSEPLLYKLKAENKWKIDIDDLERKLVANKNISGILLINPGNPTGAVFAKSELQSVVSLAKKYNCFIIADAIYERLRFPQATKIKLTDVLGEVPALVLRGMSKEVPWPGARCGWMEFFNLKNHPNFADFYKALVDTKMQEVCSTTLPQQVLPDIISDDRWEPYLKERNKHYANRAAILVDNLSNIEGVSVVKPAGAYYASIVIDESVLKDSQTLPIDNPEVEAIVQPLLSGIPLDQRFSYYLLASEGICTVPLSSGFYSRYHGFRMTLLEPVDNDFKQTTQSIKKALQTYLSS